MKNLSTIEKAKKLKQLKDLLTKAQASKGLDLAKTLKEIMDVRAELGFNNTQSNTPLIPSELYQAIIDGELTLTQEVLQRVVAEYEKDPDHYQAVPAVQILYDEWLDKYE